MKIEQQKQEFRPALSRLELYQQSQKRVRAMKFADPVTNICAGENNRLMYFVEHKGRNVRCTNGTGDFGDYGIEVIYPGHIDYPTCCEMFTPVHAVLYGTTTT